MPVMLVLVVGGSTITPLIVVLGAHPDTTAVGYQPPQPVAYSHALHAGKLQIDCRYCHSTVEKTGFAALPPTQTCMNCHATIKADSPLLQPVRDSFTKGTAIPWKKVHDLPDYVYFNHAVHVNQGIGCISCHGRIDQMDVVRQEKSLSMAWCLECHRAPEMHLRPREQVTNMAWAPNPATGTRQGQLGLELKKQYGIANAEYMTSCSICHR